MDQFFSISEEPINGNRTYNRGRQRAGGRGGGYHGRGEGYHGRGVGYHGRGEGYHGRGGGYHGRGGGYHGREGYHGGGEGNHGGRGYHGRGERNRGRGGRWGRGQERDRGRGQIVEYESFGLSDEAIINSQQNQTPENIPSVDSNTVLRYLVNRYNGSCLVTDLQELPDLFPSDSTSETVSQSLSRCRNIRVLINEENHGLSAVRVIMTSLRLCFRHAPPKPCDRGGCKHIHLCRDFIMDCCYRRNCICSHNINSEHNLRLMTECGAQIFSTEQKLVLTKCSNMMVCSDYNSPTGCTDQGSCLRLHICSAFVMNRCLVPNNECPEGHDLWSDQNRKILNLYNVDRLPEETIFKMLLTIRKKTQSFNDKMASLSMDFCEAEMSVEPELVPVPEMAEEVQRPSTPNAEIINSHVTVEESSLLKSEHVSESERMTSPERKFIKFTDYLDSKYEPLPQLDVTKNVCEVFEEHECNAKENCTDRHDCRAAYLWRINIDGEWRSLEKSSSIEEAFCDPNNNEFFDVESMSNTCIRIDFDQMESNVGRVQRLTTPSYVNCRDQADSTMWQWYWNNSLTSSGNWISYAATGEPPYPDILEQKFQFDPMLICCFEIDKFFYELDFKTMTQTNLQTQTRRKARRRPLKGNKAPPYLYIDYHCDLSKLPAQWVPMDTESRDGTELIPLHSHGDTYKDIKRKFHATVDETKHTIRRIYRVQNLDLWTSYQIKKDAIDKYMEHETEVMVYHGTAEEETTRWICGVGFDQRMHGVNGTVYGKGAYFATTARYSHAYTKPSPRNNFRYMFYAKITVGKVAKGDSSMKRPPPIDVNNAKKGLYDSCVDKIHLPGIHVIFENNQTYPAYLIEYRDNVVDTYDSMRSTSSFISVGLSTPGNQTASVARTNSNQYFAHGNYSNVVPPSNPAASSSGWNPPSNPTASSSGWNPPSNPTGMSSNISGSSSSASSLQPKQSSCSVM